MNTKQHRHAADALSAALPLAQHLLALHYTTHQDTDEKTKEKEQKAPKPLTTAVYFQTLLSLLLPALCCVAVGAGIVACVLTGHLLFALVVLALALPVGAWTTERVARRRLNS